ncbi:NnrU family protein [Motiliproteus coralliicola]|uniref:NnrU family protein n=1 Tax=Motiliproteus coralliicola TaxID=2283196 RepID=UPI000E09034B|nr:NnrU family protein [Motiliproteus coralliicola]
MAALLSAIVVFILSHMIPMRPKFRQPLEQCLGRVGFLIAYSILSLLIIGWLGHAFAQAPFVQLWPWSIWAAWLPVVLMPIASFLIVAGLSSKNPFSLGAGAQGFDLARPGIVTVSRHPVMWGLVLWSGSHIPVNGDVAGLLLFGLMLLLSLAGTFTMERVKRRRYSADEWERMLKNTVNVPFASPLTIDWGGIGWWRVLLGAVLYLALLFAHQPVIGIAPPVFY